MSAKSLVLVRSKDLFQGLNNFFLSGQAIDDHLSFYFMDDMAETVVSEFLQVKADRAVHLACLDADYAYLKGIEDRRVKRIWYNPGGVIAPDRYPMHDAEIRHLDEMSDLNNLLDKPSLDQCLAWLDAWDIPHNVRTHSDVVSWSAYVLAVKLRNKGIEVDPVLTHRGGMLHDIDKIATLKMDGAHGKMGADFLLKQGYPRLAEILREHIMTRIMRPEAQAWGWEVKLVYFCDKLVEGDRLVTFDTRLDALKERYPHYVGPMLGAVPAIWALSDEICGLLGIKNHMGLIEMLRTYQ